MAGVNTQPPSLKQVKMDNTTPLSTITRTQNAVNDPAWIKDFLRRAPQGVLATAVCLQEGQPPQPFTSTLLFVYDEPRHAIYLHAARRGRVWNNIHANPRVCFTTTQMGRLLPSHEALHFNVEHAGVVVFGTICLVDEPVEAEYGLQLILDKYFPHLRPGRDYRPITETERSATAVYRLDISEWSGKREEAPPDFPGAFFWEKSD